FADSGLPPFLALALVYAAGKKTWPPQGNQNRAAIIEYAEEYSTWVNSNAKKSSGSNAPFCALKKIEGKRPDIAKKINDQKRPFSYVTMQVLKELDRLNILVEEKSISLTPSYIHALFQPATSNRLSTKDSAAISSGFRAAVSILAEPENRTRHSAGEVFEDAILFLYATLIQYPGEKSGDAFEMAKLREKTGIDHTEIEQAEEMKEELAAAEIARSLMHDATDESETGRILALARSMIPAMRLPRNQDKIIDFAAGGYAGVVNRGDPDKLIISELAHDDIMLSARIAMNEALYLRPEPPQRPHRPQCRIAIDTSIRMWGTPRVVAFSAAVALVGTLHKEAQVKALVLTENGLEEAKLLSREGIASALAHITRHRHPGKEFSTFVSDQEDGEASQRVVIMSEDAWLDHEFQKSLPKSIHPETFVATVERDGKFRLRKVGEGSRIIRKAKFDTELLLRQPAKDVNLSRDKSPFDDSFPLILSTSPFPLRLTAAAKVDHSDYANGIGVAAVSKDKQVMLWDDAERAATVISSINSNEYPLSTHISGSPANMDSDPPYFNMILKGGVDKFSLMRVDIQSGESVRIPIDKTPWMNSPEVVWLQNCVAAINGIKYTVISMHTGEVTKSGTVGKNHHSRHISNRFWLSERSLCMLDPNGEVRTSELNTSFPEREFSCIADVPELDGIYVIRKNGEVYSLANSGRLKLEWEPQPNQHFHRYLPAAKTLYLSNRDNTRKSSYNLKTKRYNGGTPVSLDDLNNIYPDMPTNYSLHKKIATHTRICIFGDDLHMGFDNSKKRRKLGLTKVGKDTQLTYGSYSSTNEQDRYFTGSWKLMRSVKAFAGQSFTLGKVELDNKLVVWGDNRGMLHLTREGVNVQMTIVLSSGDYPALGCWMSNGTYFGPDYWHKSGARITGEEFIKYWNLLIKGAQ
ncbi:MAG: hypothetical protein JXR97_16165, partial [Planctomycetes bacterium]|nr:hypothetical protein [Planctomycetota bacterium]